MNIRSVAEVARLFGKSNDWIGREAAAGRIPSRKIGKTRVFTDDDVAEYLDRVRAGADPMVKASLRRKRAS